MLGNEILARALRAMDVERVFFIMGGPFVDAHNECESAGISMIDVRHEQAAAMMALAEARITRRTGVCMACSGPGAMNLVTGVAHAQADAAPLVAIGGSSALAQDGQEPFQETDQVGVFRPLTKWSARCMDARRIPELIATAFRVAAAGRPGPVYLDMPGDVLYSDVPEDEVAWVQTRPERECQPASVDAVDAALDALRSAKRPLIAAGSGVVWSQAEDALRAVVDRFGLPVWTTPSAKGVVPESGGMCFPAARSAAFRGCDLILQVGTRQNYVFSYFSPPRFAADATLVQIEVDPAEVGRMRTPEVALVGDARVVLEQLLERAGDTIDPSMYREWVDGLAEQDRGRRESGKPSRPDDMPIHPVALCEEIARWLPEEAIVATDGHEILSFARQTLLFDRAEWLSSGTYGTMGVGLPFAVGAKAVAPERPVVVLHGDGSFGLNAMEMDTAVRHGLPVICVISNNGGWSATDRYKAGRELGTTRYDSMFEPLGCFTAFVEDIGDLVPALQKAHESGRPAVINVVTDSGGRAATAKFTEYMT